MEEIIRLTGYEVDYGQIEKKRHLSDFYDIIIDQSLWNSGKIPGRNGGKRTGTGLCKAVRLLQIWRGENPGKKKFYR